MPKISIPILTLSIMLLACSNSNTQLAPSESLARYEAEIDVWRSERLANLTSDTGWLSLSGLYTIDQAVHSLGSGDSADFALPASAPARLGELQATDDTVSLVLEPGVQVTSDGQPVSSPATAFDADGNAKLFEVGSVNFFVIQRGDRRLLRVRDRNHPDRSNFRGIESFAVNPDFRFEARFEPYVPVKQIQIANIIGVVSDNPSWGAVAFEHDGVTYRIDAVAEPGDEELFLIFGDSTSGEETYGAGRYLYVDAPDAEGTIDLDFNKAYNPPCAFTPFATCPLPPRQNRLALRIEAGEKNYTSEEH